MAVMKKIGFISAAIFLLILVIPFQQVSAQEKSKEEKEKEQQMKEIIDAQKKAMTEQKKAQEEWWKAFEEQKSAYDDPIRNFHLQVDTDGFGNAMRIYGDRSRDWFNYSGERGDRLIITPEMGTWSPFYAVDSERTTWDFSKSVKETTFSRDYTFDVEPTVGTVIMSVNGDCKAGDIRIKITMPNGKTYSDIIVDESGSLNWRKSFKISDEENQDKAGAWKFEIKSNKATGYFKISLQTY